MSDCTDILMLTGIGWPCPDCAGERIFVAPDPLEAGARGADYCCTDCGAAIFIDPCASSAEPIAPLGVLAAGAA